MQKDQDQTSNHKRKHSLIKPIILGVFIAALLLLFFPNLKQQNLLLLNDSNKETKESTPPVFSFSSAINKAAPSVVIIYTTNIIQPHNNSPSHDLNPEVQKGLGSGIIMNEQGYILTNYHVIAEAAQISIFLQDTRHFNAQLIGIDPRTDLAVLKINATNLPIIPQNIDYKPHVGDVVFAIGNPYNIGQTVTTGIISAIERNNIDQYQSQELIQTDAAINQGNSGGALINSNGELVGINTASFKDAPQTETNGIAFAIPYSVAKYVMTQIIADGRVIRGYVGISGKEVIESRINTPQNYGIKISEIASDSPAEKSGLLPNDIITYIDDEPIYIASVLFKKLQQLKPGTKITLSILRGQKEMKIPVIVGEEK